MQQKVDHQADKNALHPQVHQLKNGMKAVILERHQAPVVAVQFWVGVGSADEDPSEGGLAHVHEHMLFKGTKKRGVGEIAAEIEASGGDINAWTSLDQTVYHVVISSRHFETAVDVLSDSLTQSAFDPDELERELEVILEEIKRSEDQPHSRVSRALFKHGFKEHPYGRPVIGHAEVVSEFTREQILAFYKAHYQPERITAVIVGDVKADDAIASLENAFKNHEGQARPMIERPAEPAQNEARVCGLTDKVEEAQLAIGFRIPSISHEDLAALDVLSVILGQGESSRLSQKVQREQRVVNEAYAYAYTPRDNGMFVVGASLTPEKLEPAAIGIIAEVKRIQNERVSNTELTKAKTLLGSEAIFQLETVEGLARRVGYWQTMIGDPSYEERYQERVAQVSADDVQRVAKRYLQKEKSTWVALVKEEEVARVSDDALLSLVDLSFDDKSSASVHTGPKGLQRHVLSTGARLIIEPDNSVPIVVMRSAWLGGLRVENDATQGYSHLASQLLTLGTSRKSAQELSSQSDQLAARLSGFSGRNSFGFRGTFLKENAQQGLALARECLVSSTFEGPELERVKEQTLEDIKNRADHPSGLAFDLFNKTLWKSHPYRRETIGTQSSISKVSAQDLQTHYAQSVDREGAVICLAGDIDPAFAIDYAESLVNELPALERAKTFPKVEEAPTQPQLATLVRDRAQAHMVVGHRGLTLNDPDRFALEILSSVLSGQGGRLFLELRDKQSLCYSVSAFTVDGIEPGMFAVYMASGPEKVRVGLEGIDNLLDELLQKGIEQKELDRSQRYLAGAFDISLQRLGTRATSALFGELYGTGFDSYRQYVEKIEAVTREDVLRVARRVLDPQTRITTIVSKNADEFSNEK